MPCLHQPTMTLFYVDAQKASGNNSYALFHCHQDEPQNNSKFSFDSGGLIFNTTVFENCQEMSEIENKSFKEKNTISGPHFTLGFDDDFNGIRKLFYFSYVMNFWVKQDT